MPPHFLPLRSDTPTNITNVCVGHTYHRINDHIVKSTALLLKTFRSTTFKLALLSIVLFGIIVLVLLAYVYWSTASYVRNRFDRAVMLEQGLLQKVYNEAGRDGLVATLRQRIADERFEGNFYLLADPSFAPIVGNLKVWPLALHGSGLRTNVGAREWKENATEEVRGASEALPDGYHLLIGRDVGNLNAFLGTIQTAVTLVIALVLFLAGVCCVSVTRRTVGRIEAINATSQAIMKTGLGKRIPLRGTQDEWDQLAENLNSMFGRIEQLMREVKQVTDNVAHDLRTPLARVRGRLEKAYNGQRDGDSDQLLISDVMTDLDAVLGMFSALLRISQIEGYDRNATVRTVNLGEIAEEVVELFDAAAEEKSVHLGAVVDQRVLVRADRDLLFDAVANLVDNAIKYGREAGHVAVKVMQSNGASVISVVDDGPGIPSEEYQNVFRRFYRLETARHSPGNGLGLSLVAAVARLHGGTIKMVDAAPGLNFEIHFPYAD